MTAPCPYAQTSAAGRPVLSVSPAVSPAGGWSCGGDKPLLEQLVTLVRPTSQGLEAAGWLASSPRVL